LLQHDKSRLNKWKQCQ